MALKLEIVQTPQGVTPTEAQKTISEQGGSIGRGENNTWILADPERFLSSRHCEIAFEAGKFYLVDTSTNGTFWNGAPEPVGRGSRVALADGDYFEVGDYRFNVCADAADDVSGDVFNSSPIPNDPLDPFDIPASPFASSSSSAVTPSASIDDFLGNMPLEGSGGIVGAGGFDSLDTDPLAALDKVAPKSDPFSAPLENSGSLFSASSDAGVESYAYGQNTVGDSGSSMSDAFTMPEPQQNDGLIPEDWEEDWLNTPVEDPAPSNVKPKLESETEIDLEPSAQDFEAPDLEIDDYKAPAPAIPQPRAQGRPAVQPASRRRSLEDPIPDSRRDLERPARRDIERPSRRDISEPNAVSGHRGRPVQQPRPAAREDSTRKAQLKDAAATSKILLEAMGLDSDRLSPQEQQEITRQVGELLPVIIQGMMNVLRSRASIKNEFRMSVTTIQPVENNPLKFSADTREAMENMFVRDSRAYKGPVEAFSEGFDAIAEHQIAIIAGIRAAFSSMLDQFDPEKLETQFDKQSKGMVLPGMQKARYWSSYTDFYQSAVDNIEQSFQNLFGDEFVRAYEDQLFKLVSSRNQKL